MQSLPFGWCVRSFHPSAAGTQYCTTLVLLIKSDSQCKINVLRQIDDLEQPSMTVADIPDKIDVAGG